MDVFTHALSGAVIGMLYRERDGAGEEFSAGAPLPGGTVLRSRAEKGVRLTTAIAAVLPDIDIVMMLAGPFAYFRYHRGPTHSLPGIIILSAVLALVMSRFYPVAKKKLFLWALLGTAVHVGLDLLTSYSTFLFWPFSSRPYFSGILRFSDRTGWYLLGGAWILGLAAARFRGLRLKAVHFALAAALLYGGYIGVRAWVRYDMASVLAEQAMESEIARFIRAFTPFLHISIREAGDGHIVGLGDLRYGTVPRLRAEIVLAADGTVVGESYYGFGRRAERRMSPK